MRDKKDLKKVRPRKKKPCPFCLENAEEIDYKDDFKLRRFMTDRGKIIPRRNSSVCAKHQRKLSMAIKRARSVGLVPFSID
ncbi:30S ribosomal protein S18 [Candidatus Margulisiibacteriota bacterium]